MRSEYQNQLLSIAKAQSKAMGSFAFPIIAPPYIGMGRAVIYACHSTEWALNPDM
jgi:hypothetical protein